MLVMAAMFLYFVVSGMSYERKMVVIFLIWYIGHGLPKTFAVLK